MTSPENPDDINTKETIDIDPNDLRKAHDTTSREVQALQVAIDRQKSELKTLEEALKKAISENDLMTAEALTSNITELDKSITQKLKTQKTELDKQRTRSHAVIKKEQGSKP